MKEITRNWNVKVFDRYFLFKRGKSWSQICDDVEAETTDTGLCSMWQNIESYNRMDLSNYFGYLCNTFLVPKPRPITQVSYLYIPLSTTVWWTTIGTLLVTAFLYYILYRVLLQKHTQDDRLEVFCRTMLDIISISTSHGIPKIANRISIQLLVISWLILILLLSSAYNTKYTSILTQPRYTTAVDNLQDFVDEGGMQKI